MGFTQVCLCIRENRDIHIIEWLITKSHPWIPRYLGTYLKA